MRVERSAVLRSSGSEVLILLAMLALYLAIPQRIDNVDKMPETVLADVTPSQLPPIPAADGIGAL